MAHLKNASRSQILEGVEDFRNRLREQDNFLIYYAGHGTIDLDLNLGYWQPVDAKPDSRVNWIRTNDITEQLMAFKSNNAIIIADSCYSAAIFRGETLQDFESTLNKDTLARMIEEKSRVAISSGSLEPVPDSINGSKYSIFASSLNRVLSENDQAINANQLFELIRRRVIPISSAAGVEQTPQFDKLRQYGHEGGDFIFARAKE